ncbi:cell division control protein [Irineochytrium annulatum]|nr:cell division control protein [Irineochytrium annulatum]
MAALTAEKKTTLTGYVGFDTITSQIERKLVKRGFSFNLMVVGRSGLGKSTLVNTIFAAHLVESKSPKKGELTRQTTEIQSITHGRRFLRGLVGLRADGRNIIVIEENGVKLKLTLTDTPGYGDQVNNEACWEPICKFIKEQYSSFLRKELTPAREKRINDTRVHAVLFFVAPTGHSLAPLDITVMKKLSEIANVIPVIAKSDSLTMEERAAFKRRIKEELDFHGIRCYPYTDMDEEFPSSTEADRVEKQAAQAIRDMIPFAIVGSERNIVVDGKAVRGRRTRWGLINVENESHCEFVALRNFLTRTHLQDLIETTSGLHYETFRTKQLLALKESTSVTSPSLKSGSLTSE